VYALVGELGSGKTEFARGFVEALCGPAAVRSPTFSIVNIHESPDFPCIISISTGSRARGACGNRVLRVCPFERSVLIEWADMFPILPRETATIRFVDKGTTGATSESDRCRIVVGIPRHSPRHQKPRSPISLPVFASCGEFTVEFRFRQPYLSSLLSL